VNWDGRIISEEELTRYLKGQSRSGLAARVEALIEQQRRAWPLLREGYEALSQAETKRVRVEESEVVIQHNPKRIRSTAASIDKAAISERRCFLCGENLPPEEKGIQYGSDLIILCNPFPILNRHLSIVHRQHVEQKIYGYVEGMLRLASDLGSDYFVLYNGPECGASAPDHFHLQACSRELLPIEQDSTADEPQQAAHCASCEESARDAFELFTLANCGRSVIVFRGNDECEMAEWVYKSLDELSRDAGKSEAMVNIVATHVEGVWTVYLFPRSRHRPASFFAEGDERLLVSPGAIDMAGVVVVPHHEHFLKLDGERVAAIFAEVSRDEEAVNELLERMLNGEGSSGDWI
jgi:Domain of unknown function (DUF4922)